MAILLQEPPLERLLASIAEDAIRLVSAASAIELYAVTLNRGGQALLAEAEVTLARLSTSVRAVDGEQVSWARTALLRFGKGRHPAGLNFGDCFSYALAKATGEPLLFVGDDFSQTDVAVVDWRNTTRD
jgi:ribonuclease VapC